jgi:hypothetical protein
LDLIAKAAPAVESAYQYKLEALEERTSEEAAAVPPPVSKNDTQYR